MTKKKYMEDPSGSGKKKELTFDLDMARDVSRFKDTRRAFGFDKDETERNSASKNYVAAMAEHEHNPRMINSISQEGLDETYHDWWLKKGKFFAKDKTKEVHKNKFRIYLGDMAYTMGQCFYNAQMVALSDNSYKYFEGMAQGEANVSLHHAWLVKNGKVVDPTWNGAGHDYFGVQVPTTYVRKRVLKTGHATDLLGRFWHEKVRPKQQKQKKRKVKVKGELMF